MKNYTPLESTIGLALILAILVSIFTVYKNELSGLVSRSFQKVNLEKTP